MKFATQRRGLAESLGVHPVVGLWAAVSVGLIVGYLFRDTALSAAKVAQDTIAGHVRTSIVQRGPDVRPYQGDPVGCEVPRLDIGGLQDYGCTVLRKVCFDQNKMIVFSAKPSDEFKKYPPFDLGWTPSFLPGYDQLQATDELPDQQSPVLRKNSTLERPDFKDPIFSKCHAPLVWAAPWTVAYGEFSLNNFVPLWYMQSELQLFDRRVMLAPLLDGYQAPPFVEWLLRPYTEGIITTFHDASSRFHMADPSYPRCFETAAVCNLKGMYRDRPGPKYNNTEGNLVYDGDPEWKVFQPAKAGRALVDYYTRKGVLHPPSNDTSVLRVVIANRTGMFRRFLELEPFLEACNGWAPPPGHGIAGVRCEAWTFGGPVADTQKLQETDVLIAHHGAEFGNSFFMPWGASVIEVRPKGFDGYWPDLYFRSALRQESEIFYWQAKVVDDKNWVMTDWEANNTFEFHGVKRDLNRHSIPRWRLYRPILEAIVEVERDKQKYVAKPYESVVFQV